MKLERSLTVMPDLLPDPGAVALKVTARLGLEKRRSVAGIFRRLSLVWAVAVATASLVLVVSRFDFASFLVSEQESFISTATKSMDYWIETTGGWIAGQLYALTSMDPWLLASGMIGFSILIFTAGTVAAFKALR